MIQLLKDFKPALLFLLKFVSIYILMNIGYGIYINSYSPSPDPLTYITTEQTHYLLNVLNFGTSIDESSSHPNVVIYNNSNQAILSVYEGCNGLNVMIIFLAFVASFGVNRAVVWFLPLGLAVIHISNIIRIGLLYWVSIEMANYSYFIHKYLFTASIFMVVFIFWYWWVKICNRNTKAR